MKRFYIVICLLLVNILIYSLSPADSAQSRTIRIAAFNFYPTLFQAKDGSVQGFYVDFLKEIAKREDWNIEYVYGNWSDGLARIKSGEVDLLTNVAFTNERGQFLDYSKVPLLTVWAELYVKGGSSIDSIKGVKGKKVALMKGDFNAANFKNLVEKLEIPCTYVELGDFEEVFKAISSNEVDAGVVNNTFGAAKQREYGVQSSGVVFNPFDIYFTAAKGKNTQVLVTLDKYLAEWRKVEDSPYHQARERWSHKSVSIMKVTPASIRQIIIFFILTSCIAIAFVFVLRIQVRRKTAALKQQIEIRAEAEERFLLAMKASRDGLFDWNLETNEIYYSPAWKKMLGYEDHELPNDFSVWENTTDPEDVKKSWELQQKLISKKIDRFVVEFKMKHKDGHRVDILSRAEAFFNDSGQAIRIVGTHTNISDRKRAEEELRESEERNRQILHSSIDGFWRVDSQARLIEVNDAYCRMSGYSREELLTMAVQDVEALETAEAVAARIKRIITNGSDRFTTSHRRKDGRIFEVEASIQYRSGKDGGEFVVFLRDVTEKKLLESQLLQAQKLEAIGTLAGGIAHDFNNILGAIIGYSEMVRDDLAPESPCIHGINQVLKASHRAKDLVKQILAFSRHVEDQKRPMHPAVIVKEAISLLRSSLPMTITIEQDIDPDAGSVLADPTQFHQIVMNLCTNAFQAMEVKGGTLTISLQKIILSQEDLAMEPDLQPGSFVQLLIKDTGEGIPLETRERIFDPFFTTKEVGKGTGLGLSMVYSIVKSSGGSIICDSRLGEGSEFRIILPALEDQVVEESGSTELPPHGKEHILFIDDEEMLAELGQAVLKRLGYEVTTRRNSLDALTTFQNQPDAFDMIITDQTMPGMTGVDLARRILQIHPRMPIILCTGYSSQVSEETAKAAGIKGFAFKPMTQKDIAELIRKILDEQKQ
ncbi:PAS domain S-box protein [Desulforhopalus sp. IMCC35007]|uniref:PAS domain S-box protein n=1 Tax=Desulforhopalus sp. IMCC35007 TaxID=2569543 RepID=UPI0010AE5B35|nr:PAS domain S-box protein [Desulforhopalus sp. IMCC35007]TKB12337.1 PAS domain S-box protein [Desulforhopalus sp. IMCC35007]